MLVFAAGMVSLAGRPIEYSATSRILITPKSGDDPVGASDTLSRGTVVATFAEAYGSQVIVAEALTKAGIPAAEQRRVEVTSRALSGPSGIVIEAVSEDAGLAEAAADAVAAARPSLDGYTDAFGSRLLASASGTATRTGASATILIALLVAASIACGIAAFAVGRRMGRRGAEDRAATAQGARGLEPPAPEGADMPQAEWLSRRV